MVLDDKNPWEGILAFATFAWRATVHTTMQYTPAKLVFGRYSIINYINDIDWKIIRKQRQDVINKGTKHENGFQINHTYKQGYKVSLKNVWKTKFNQDTYIGPYFITVVRNNNAAGVHKRRVTDTFNIQNICLYKE